MVTGSFNALTLLFAVMIPSSFFLDTAKGRHALHGLIWRSGAAHALPPLVCVHGLTRNAWDFSDLASALCETRDVIALDMPGRGFSAHVAAQEYTGPTYMNACVRALDQLGYAKVDWCGTSMGGIIGMMMAAQHAPRINKLILNDVGPLIPISALRRIAQYVGAEQDFATLEDAMRFCRATYADFGITDNAAWRRFALVSVTMKENGHYRLAYDTAIALTFSAATHDVAMWDIYDAIKAPVLALRGARSDLLLPGVAAEMTQRGPKALLRVFEGCGHAPALQEASQIEAVRGFLNG